MIYLYIHTHIWYLKEYNLSFEYYMDVSDKSTRLDL